MQSAIESNIENLQNPEFRKLAYSAFGATIPGHNYRGYGILKLDDECRHKPRKSTHVSKLFSTRRPLWFIFPGLGSQVERLEEELTQSVSPFASSLNASCRILRKQVGMDLRDFLASGDLSTISGIQVGCVALTAIQVGIIARKKQVLE